MSGQQPILVSKDGVTGIALPFSRIFAGGCFDLHSVSPGPKD
jgi:hypothetical protein